MNRFNLGSTSKKLILEMAKNQFSPDYDDQIIITREWESRARMQELDTDNYRYLVFSEERIPYIVDDQSNVPAAGLKTINIYYSIDNLNQNILENEEDNLRVPSNGPLLRDSETIEYFQGIVNDYLQNCLTGIKVKFIREDDLSLVSVDDFKLRLTTTTFLDYMSSINLSANFIAAFLGKEDKYGQYRNSIVFSVLTVADLRLFIHELLHAYNDHDLPFFNDRNIMKAGLGLNARRISPIQILKIHLDTINSDVSNIEYFKRDFPLSQH